MLCCELVDGVVEDEHLVALLRVLLQDGAPEDRVLRVAGQVENRVLVVLHSADILIERYEAVGLLCSVESGKKSRKTDEYVHKNKR